MKTMLLILFFIFTGYVCANIIGEKIDNFAHHIELEEFRQAGVRAGTDKVTDHNYQYMYGKYLSHESMHLHGNTIKVLEIGLGCNMQYGPGKTSICMKWNTMKNVLSAGKLNLIDYRMLQFMLVIKLVSMI